MTDEEMNRYNDAMRNGRYFEGLDIVLKAQEHELPELVMPAEADPEAEQWVFVPKVKITKNIE